MSKNKKNKIAVIGAGSWGTTLAVLLADKEYDVSLWTHREETHKEILYKRKNIKYTKDLILPDNITVFYEIDDYMISGSEIIILAVPSHALRETVKKFYDVFESTADSVRCVLNVAKGFETGTNLRLSEVLEEVLPDPLKKKTCSLSGPNIAVEVARKLPSVSVVASKNTEILKFIQSVLSTDNFRIYTNKDVPGVEIGGAIKNIIAIASGISDGLGYGANTKASLITRGLHELSKFGTKLGANPLTFSGAAVMGDLIATCISEHSRNRSVGERLASGEKIDQIMNSMYMVAEGVRTTKAVYEIAIKNNLDVPITECIYEIIYKNLSPEKSVKKLMSRKFKPEIEDLI
ncbi:MAG: NAD(P)-dependent glycerol-3-phosphate dehydrogenase [Actinobacteria bacterium]|nr:NAD(P)-dependent glycerol-3-phosphate dehydrogenase [Actinomycetota bacterium]